MASPGYIGLVTGNRNFRLLWTAQIVSELGDWLYTVAVYSLLIESTGSARSLGVAFLLQVLPLFFIAPAAGIVNDRLSRKRVMIFADWSRAAIVLAMLLARGPGSIWMIYVLLFLETVLFGFFEPGRNAVIPNIVPARLLIKANNLASITWSFNFAAGAALGGFIAAYLGRGPVFVLNALSFVASALLIRRMRFAEPHSDSLPPVRLRSLLSFSPIAEGIRYVRGDARLTATFFVKCGLGLLGANWVIVPILGERVFPVFRPGFDAQRAGMLGMSVLMAARGLGAICGPVFAVSWAGESMPRLRLAIGIGFVAAFFGYVGLGLAPSMPLACASLVLAHGGLSAVWVFSTAMLQIQTEDRYRGRVFSAEFGFAVLTMAASSFLAGVLVDRGVPASRVATLTGMAMLVPAFAWTWAQRYWRRGAGA